MEKDDGALLMCPNCSLKTMIFSRNHLRKTRRLDYNCPSCGHREIIDVNTKSELLSELLGVTIGENRKIESRNIVQASADKTANIIHLTFQDGERMEIHTSRLLNDLDTLESCGVAVAY